jgi:hypothetical protein
LVRKILGLNSPGSATELGGDDYDMINQYLTGVDQTATDPVPIKTETTFWDNRLKFYNPLATKKISIRTLAVLNNYDFTIPLLSSNDEIVGLITAQQLQNKTIHIDANTLKHSTTNALGDILVFNGIRYERVPMGTTPGYVLGIKSDLSGLEWISAPASAASGEVNVGSNIGTAGVGVYHSKSGLSLRFKKINAATNGRITVTDDTTNNEIDIGITGGTDGQFLKTVGTTPTWTTLTSQYGTVMPDGTNFSGTRYGKFMGGAPNGEGQLAGVTTHGNLGSNVGLGELTTTFTSESEDEAVAGWITPIMCTQRSYNPHFKVRYRQTLTTEKSWVGYIDSTEPIVGSDGDNPLQNKNGFMYGFAESDANFLIRWNDGSASPQTFNTGIPKDLAYRNIEFFIDETVDQIKLYINNVLTVNSGTQVPGTDSDLSVYFLVESAGGTATTVRMNYAYLTHTATG